jgi:predicted kinase
VRAVATPLPLKKGENMLYIFGGLPGAGKSTLARDLAQRERAVYLRVDTIEQALREAGRSVVGPEGYGVAYRIAEENLHIGLSVVADMVNPLLVTRAAWRAVAVEAQVPFVEVEVVCSDPAEHRRRVERRRSDIVGLRLPTWDDVLRREYEAWETVRIVVDTAGQRVEQSIAALQRLLDSP